MDHVLGQRMCPDKSFSDQSCEAVAPGQRTCDLTSLVLMS